MLRSYSPEQSLPCKRTGRSQDDRQVWSIVEFPPEDRNEMSTRASKRLITFPKNSTVSAKNVRKHVPGLRSQLIPLYSRPFFGFMVEKFSFCSYGGKHCPFTHGFADS